MKRFIVFSSLILVMLFGAITSAPAAPATDPTYTLTVSPVAPVHGDTATFTGTFPSVAFRQAHNTQFHQNPYLSLNCGDANVTALQGSNSFFKTGVKQADGSIQASTYYPLDSPTWPVGATETCYAYSGYWTDTHSGGVQWNQVAGPLVFYVTG